MVTPMRVPKRLVLKHLPVRAHDSDHRGSHIANSFFKVENEKKKKKRFTDQFHCGSEMENHGVQKTSLAMKLIFSFRAAKM